MPIRAAADVDVDDAHWKLAKMLMLVLLVELVVDRRYDCSQEVLMEVSAEASYWNKRASSQKASFSLCKRLPSKVFNLSVAWKGGVL